MDELVSIIIPVYNMGDSLRCSVKSLQCQDYKNIEILLVDDGSKDNTYQVCEELEMEDPRIRCIHTENRGAGPARNAGIQASKGRYMYFPDADDFLEQNAITVLVNAMDHGKYDLVVFGYRNKTHSGDVVFEKKYEKFENSGDEIRKKYEDYFEMTRKYSIQGAPWNKFFDGNVIRKYKIEYPSLRRHQDEGFISRYVSYCNNVKFIPEILYNYYVNSAGLEWKKYPVDYIDAVIGLDKVWKETICQWNKDDIVTHDLVEKRIFSNIIKAMELSYSPKMGLNYKSRKEWLKNSCKKTGFSEYSMDVAGSLYQRLVLLFAKLHLKRCLQLILYLGVLRTKARQGK